MKILRCQLDDKNIFTVVIIVQMHKSVNGNKRKKGEKREEFIRRKIKIR